MQNNQLLQKYIYIYKISITKYLYHDNILSRYLIRYSKLDVYNFINSLIVEYTYMYIVEQFACYKPNIHIASFQIKLQH